MGMISYVVYVYIPARQKYQRIVLRVDGDWSYYNKSENALKLLNG